MLTPSVYGPDAPDVHYAISRRQHSASDREDKTERISPDAGKDTVSTVLLQGVVEVGRFYGREALPDEEGGLGAASHVLEIKQVTREFVGVNDERRETSAGIGRRHARCTSVTCSRRTLTTS